MAEVGTRRAGPVPAAASPPSTPLVLVDQPDAVTHLVCCRSDDWRRTFCGSTDSDAVNVTAQRYCAMCVEEAESALPGWTGAEHRVCPRDGRRCPDDAELDARIAHATQPSRWHRGRRRR